MADDKKETPQEPTNVTSKTTKKPRGKKTYQVVRVYKYVYNVEGRNEEEALHRAKEMFVSPFNREKFEMFVVSDKRPIDF